MTIHERLRATGFDSAILSVVPAYAREYAPQTVQGKLPKPLQDLYSSDHVTLDYDDLVKVCNDEFAKISLSKEQVRFPNYSMSHSLLTNYVCSGIHRRTGN